MDTKGYIIISIISVIEIILTIFITLNIAVMAELSKEGLNVGFFECFGLIFEVMETDPSISAALITDIILSIVCIVAGILTYFFIEKKNNKTVQTSGVEQRIDQPVDTTNEDIQPITLENNPEEEKETTADPSKKQPDPAEELRKLNEEISQLDAKIKKKSDPKE